MTKRKSLRRNIDVSGSDTPAQSAEDNAVVAGPEGAVIASRAGIEARLKSVPQYEISLADADGYAFTEQEVLERELSKLGLFGSNYAYSAFNPKLVERLLKTGTYHDSGNNINCCIVNSPLTDESGIRDNDEYDLFTYLDQKAEGGVAVFAVLDKSQLSDDKVGHPFYCFRHPENRLAALVAVVRIPWK